MKSKNLSIREFDNFLKTDHFPLWLAVNHHKTHTNKRMTMEKHMYLKWILMDKSHKRVCMKSTQGGISEGLIIIAWSFAYGGKVVFYVLPTDGLKQRFVTNRFEKSLSLSKFYRQKRSEGFSERLSKDLIDNQSLKDIGKGTVSFAGSKSDIPFVELPADVFIVDEADLCDPKRLEMGLERLGHCDNPYEIYAGNPTFIGSFLDEKFKSSTMGLWNIPCNCGNKVQIDFFKHVVLQVDEKDYIIRDKEFEFHSGMDINPICDNCNRPFDRFADGMYIESKESDISGKHVSRLFSGMSTMVEIVNKFSKALENDYKLQRFYNSDLGLPFTAEGAKITENAIRNNMSDYYMPDKSDGPCVMGVDTGNDLHVRINKILPGGKLQAVYIDKVDSLSDLLSLCKRYNVITAVIDGLPEIRMARAFSHSALGHFRCFFGNDKSDSVNLKEKMVTVSRTLVMDEMKEKITIGKIIFPKNILSLDEYMAHIKEPIRTFDEDHEEYKWLSNRADHFFLAETYCSLAEKLIKFISR